LAASEKEEKIVLDDSLIGVNHFIQQFRQDPKKFLIEMRHFSCWIDLVVCSVQHFVQLSSSANFER